jgi:hypothetical protein
MRASIQRGIFEFFHDKTFCSVYLFIIWSIVFIYFHGIIPALIRGHQADFQRLFWIFVDPPTTIWFVYALAIVSLLLCVCRNVPLIWIFTLALVAYMVSAAGGDWRGAGFTDKVVRLIPFFVLGLCSFEIMRALVIGRAWLLALALPAYVAGAMFIFELGWERFGPLTFLISCIGIFGALGLARLISITPLAPLALYVGSGSLYIYLIHRLIQYWTHPLANRLFGKDFIENNITAYQCVIFFLILAICPVFGRFMSSRPETAWLFARPRFAASRLLSQRRADTT